MTKQKVNKTAEIKAALAKYPDLSPKQIADKLSARGIKVSAAYVSTTKSDMKRDAKTAKAKSDQPSDLVSVASLVEAKKFADKVGGLNEARQLVEYIGKLA